MIGKRLSVVVMASCLVIAPLFAKGPCENLCGSCDCKAFSRTFLSVRPHYATASPEKTVLFRDRPQARENGCGGAFQIVPFGSASTNRNEAARFFGPSCNTKISVVEDEDAVDRTDIDLLARHFNIHTVDGTFKSTIEFQPRQTVFGIGLTYQQEFYETNGGKHVWFELSSPIERIKNDMHLCERIEEDGGGALDATFGENQTPVVGNMVDAFRQKSWCFGKIDKCDDLDKWCLGDIEAKLGWWWTLQDSCYIESFIGAIIPTCKKPKAEYVFEPIAGRNRHFGFHTGSELGYEIWVDDKKDRHLWIHMDLNSEYILSRSEKRSFDLKCKKWSRYMEVYKNKEEAIMASMLSGTEGVIFHTPGINVFTQDLTVSPRFNHTQNTALVFTSGQFKGEVGYGFYARAAECVELDCPWQEGPALKAFVSSIGSEIPSSLAPGATNRVQTICESLTCNSVGIEDYDQNIIQAGDLDLESAATPALLSHTFYGSLGYRWDERDYPIFAGIGASYEWNADNIGLDRWTVWGKFGISF